MTMFSVCTSYATDGQLEETLKANAEVEKYFTHAAGVLDRQFFQCQTISQVLWTYTEWETEDHHNDAAQKILKTRRDDRFSCVSFGPEQYFEIFCRENNHFSLGRHNLNLDLVIVGHVVIAAERRDEFHVLRESRFKDLDKSKIAWLRVFENTYNPDEFTFFLGFSEREHHSMLVKDGIALEEWLFTGLKDPLEMSAIAAYNQFHCRSIDLKDYL
jgi:hypothetical protein